LPDSLEQFFQDIVHHLRHGRVAVLGVGNPLRGDDGLGPDLAQRLVNRPRLISIDCEEMPENYTGVVRDHRPTLVLIVDAVDFNGAPGDLVVLGQDDLQQERFSSHKPSLALLMQFLRDENQVTVILLGMQPAQRGFREGLSPAVETSVRHLSELFERFSLSIEKEENRCSV